MTTPEEERQLVEAAEYEAVAELLKQTMRGKHETGLALAYWLLYRDRMGRLEECWSHAHSTELMDDFRRAAVEYESAYTIWAQKHHDRFPEAATSD